MFSLFDRITRRKRAKGDARAAVGARRYPSFVHTEVEQERWDIAAQAAARVVEGLGGNQETVLLATRALYKSDISTFPSE